ncbi:mitochondrial ribonuclease P catalytic subunit isoform X1 [Osmia lignaria lignaria]|uniref:mitochondrial ribonuclease P catalytic subunit isoform X1 n=1 Tax=Osmia lignaria lignaria TaxID=1437193 RepID=UPI00402BBA08
MAIFNKVLCLRQLQYLYINVRRLSNYDKRRDFQFCDDLKDKFLDILIKPNSISNETWESIRKYGVELTSRNPEVVDSMIFEILRKENCLDAGLNYYKFLKTNNYNCSIIAAKHYLLLSQLKETLTDAEKADILNLCKEVKEQHKFLPSFIAQVIIRSLCRLDKWEEAIDTIEQFEKHDSTLMTHAYHTVIEYLFKNNKPKLGSKYMFIYIQKGVRIDDNLYSLYLKYCLQEKDTFNNRIEKLFSYWRKYGAIPTKETTDECIKACNEAGWSAQIVTVSNLQCSACHEMLEETQLSENEIKRLFEAVKSNVITDNAYKVSDPQELKKFEQFMMHNKPYDFVIDGLNSIKYVNSMNTLERMIRKLKHEGNRILVIGRHHLKKSQKIGNMKNYADFFFVNNMSKDDAFILYAALLSGKTNVISKDLMHQHKFTFHNIELTILFRRWQLRHQYFFDTKSKNLTQLRLIHPMSEFALKINNCWHIPYNNFSPHYLTKHYTVDWACFKMPT